MIERLVRSGPVSRDSNMGVIEGFADTCAPTARRRASRHDAHPKEGQSLCHLWGIPPNGADPVGHTTFVPREAELGDRPLCGHGVDGSLTARGSRHEGFIAYPLPSPEIRGCPEAAKASGRAAALCVEYDEEWPSPGSRIKPRAQATAPAPVVTQRIVQRRVQTLAVTGSTNFRGLGEDRCP